MRKDDAGDRKVLMRKNAVFWGARVLVGSVGAMGVNVGHDDEEVASPKCGDLLRRSPKRQGATLHASSISARQAKQRVLFDVKSG
jgi:hypothetical protein